MASRGKNKISLGPLFFSENLKNCRVGILLHELGHTKDREVLVNLAALCSFLVIPASIGYAYLMRLIRNSLNINESWATALLPLLTVIVQSCFILTLLKSTLISKAEERADLYAIRHLTTEKSAQAYIELCRGTCRGTSPYRNWFDEFFNKTQPSGDRYAEYLTSQCPILQKNEKTRSSSNG